MSDDKPIDDETMDQLDEDVCSENEHVVRLAAQELLAEVRRLRSRLELAEKRIAELEDELEDQRAIDALDIVDLKSQRTGSGERCDDER